MSASSPPAALEFLAGGGELGALMRAFDWTRTPVGAPSTWPYSLRVVVRILLEETYHTFSYSPVPDDGGDGGGMLCVVIEETERTIGERRLRTLRELAAATIAARTVDEARSSAPSPSPPTPPPPRPPGWGSEDKRLAADAGFDHHLTKPVDARAIAELLARIDADTLTRHRSD